MKNKNAKVKEIIFTVIFFPIVVLFLLGLLIITPFDYLKYKKSRYYKDTKEKYSWLCMVSYYVKFYDLVKKANLPIDFYRCDYAPITGYGFFVYKDILILNDYEPCYDEERDIWLVEIEDEYVDIKEEVEADIKRCNDFLKDNICTRALVFIYDEVYKEHPDVKYEKIDFLPVKNNSYIDALKTIIE